MPGRRITITLLFCCTNIFHYHKSLHRRSQDQTHFLQNNPTFQPPSQFIWPKAALSTLHETNTLNMKSRTTMVFNKGEEIILPLQWFTVYNCADLCCDVAAVVPLLHSHSWLRHYWNALNSQQECRVGIAPPYDMFHCPPSTNYKLLMHFPFQETWMSICISQK
jgi:hypothetical protein